MITITGLSRSFGSKEVLKGISLSFEAGKTYGIVGANGAGKTTLFNCMAGLLSFAGTITPDVRLMKRSLGFLQTEPYFFSRITGREYIRLLCNARRKDVGDIDQRNIFGLPLDEYAVSYSTGMRKKLALMAILMQDNEVLILDEPFNGVDMASNIMIIEIINELKKLGKTMIISSHIFSTLKDTCDEIHLMDAGCMVQLVRREQFDELEKSMRKAIISDQIQRLGLK